MSKLTNDWLYLVNTQKVTNSSAYLRHRGKPVVAIWGFGFNGRSDTPQQAQMPSPGLKRPAAPSWVDCRPIGGP